jgi:hypothetical protein
MTLNQSPNSQSNGKAANGQTVKQTSCDAKSILSLNQAGVEELTPLQRQRLDAAVMMLVNYLVSASSGT